MFDDWENKNVGGETCPNCGKRIHAMATKTKCAHCQYDFKTKSCPVTGTPIKAPSTE